MKLSLQFLIQLVSTVLFCLLTGEVYSQVSSDVAVLLTATVDTAVPSIRIQWPSDPSATGYIVMKKAKTSTYWQETLAYLPGADTSYTDFSVVADSNYDYGVDRTASTLAHGYINAGWNIHPAGYRGKLILLVDHTFADSLSEEITRLMDDISGDGWAVIRHDVEPTDSVPLVKDLIMNDYTSAPDEIRGLFLLGRVPVPYSGNLNPDGHPDHLGAWPADVYYGDMTGIYTDQNINNQTASRPENWNVPGDGKFDQSIVHGSVALQVGRVYLGKMPSFPYTETTLMKRYLDKDHAFRNNLINTEPKGLINDNFGFFSGEAFAGDGWRNFAPLLGADAVEELPYFPTLTADSYLWSYACGGGWYQGASGVGSTTDWAADTVQTVFTMLFGSYFGDWDVEDNFLRAPLASADRALTSCWAGRPYWQFHHMGLGENIGYSARLSQNNNITYAANNSARLVHIALMGDPTLRMHTMSPVSGVVAVQSGPAVNITWQPSPEPIAGYLVYRADNRFGKYSRLTGEMLPDLAFSDPQPQEGMNYYMVRAARLEQTPSGSYFNQSTGIVDSAFFVVGVSEPLAAGPDFRIFPNPAKGPFSLVFTGESPKEFTITVLDLAGRELMTKEYQNSGAVHNFRIDPGILATGLYLVTVREGKTRMVKRLEIIR